MGQNHLSGSPLTNKTKRPTNPKTSLYSLTVKNNPRLSVDQTQ